MEELDPVMSQTDCSSSGWNGEEANAVEEQNQEDGLLSLSCQWRQGGQDGQDRMGFKRLQ